MRARDLGWDGCVNVRDLGGHATEDGAVTHFGAVVRSDSVRRLSDAGWEALVGYGIRTVVDLRWHEELAEDAPRELPVDLVHVSLLGSRDDVREVDDLVRPISDPATRRSTMYLEFLERFPENFAHAVAAVARAREGAVLVHCAGGVDRTGLVVALLLRLAGVGPAAIAADYAVSERNWAPFVRPWIEEAPDDEERKHRRMLSLCRPEAMLRVLDGLQRRYGGAHGYLLGAGASAADLERARARLRG